MNRLVRMLSCWGVPILLGAAALAAVTESPSPNVLWEENFRKPFEPTSIHGLKQETNKDGQVVLADRQRKRGSSNVRFSVPVDPQYRYVQIDLAKVEGKGYRSFALTMPGQPGEIGGGYLPGLYTFDTQAAFSKRLADKKSFPLALYVAGGHTDEDPAPLGPAFTFTSLRVVKQPVEGVVIKLLDGETVRAKSKLHITVWTKAGTKDVTVEFLHQRKVFALTGQPYVQLKAENEDASVWGADIVFPNIACPDPKKKEFPRGRIQVRATVVGGSREKLFTAISYPIQWRTP